MHQDGACHTAAACGVKAVLHGHIIIDYHVIGLDILILSHIDSHFKIHHVTGVVLHHAEHAFIGGNRLNALKNLVWGRRSEDRPRHRCIQHAGAHKAPMGRLMAAAAAGNQRHLPLLLGASHHHVAAIQLPKLLRPGLHQSQDHLLLDFFHCVDDFFHDVTSNTFNVRIVVTPNY